MHETKGMPGVNMVIVMVCRYCVISICMQELGHCMRISSWNAPRASRLHAQHGHQLVASPLHGKIRRYQ